jgi:peroxiredoxin
MAIQTPICDFGQKAHDFGLKSTDNKISFLNDVKGKNGTLIMFICNHCPYVKAVIKKFIFFVYKCCLFFYTRLYKLS